MFKTIKKFFQRNTNTPPCEQAERTIPSLTDIETNTAPPPQTPTKNPQQTVLVFDTQKRVFVVKKRVARVALYNPTHHNILLKDSTGVETKIHIPLEKGQLAFPISGFWFDKETCHIGLYAPQLEKFFLLKEQQLKNIRIDAQQFVGVGDYEKMMPISGFFFDAELATIGLYDPSSALFLLKHNDESQHQGTVFQYGPLKNNMQIIIGDWAAEGKESVGLYDADSGVFFLKGDIEGNAKDDINFHFGPSNSDMQALSGDWDASGHDKVALYFAKEGLFFLKNTNTSTENDNIACYFGPKGAHISPLIGDWAGDGQDGIGVYDAQTGIAYLKNKGSSGDADKIIQFSEFEEKSIPFVVYDLI